MFNKAVLNLPEKIIVFDTEYTSWKGAQARNWSGPGEFREIVEIGAILVDTKDFSELDSIDLYILPRKNPKLSDYFIKLTGITQKKVDTEGLDFGEALKRFHVWCHDFPMYSWGNDANDIEENCKLENLTFPFDSSRFEDARKLFAAERIKVEDYMSSTIARAFGKEPTRRGHNGLSDSRSIVDGMRLLAQRKS